MSDRFYELYNYTADYGTEGSTLPSNITSITPLSPERLRTYPVRIEMDYTNNRFTYSISATTAMAFARPRSITETSLIRV